MKYFVSQFISSVIVKQMFCGKAYRKARIEMGLAQKVAAKHAGVSAPFLVDVEGGRRNASIMVAEKLVEALNLHAEGRL